MKKRLLSVILAAAMLTTPLAVPASALTPGEEIGQVLYTDIIAYIDGHAIRSYNINWNTYIVVEDLVNYGFDATWNPENGGHLVIANKRTAAPDAYTSTYQPETNTHPAGTPAMPYLYTEITTWIGDMQVTGYNIGGYTCICMDDLAAHFAAEYVWSPENKALYMTSPTAATQPDEQPPVEQPLVEQPPVESALNDAEAAVDAYIIAELTSLQSPTLTDEDLALLDLYETMYGKEYVDAMMDYTQALMDVLAELGDSISYTITDSVVGTTTASVYVTITSRDLSGAMTEFAALLMAEITRMSLRGEEPTETGLMNLYAQLITLALGDDSLPTVTNKTVVYLDLIDGVWTVNEEKSIEFLNALAGGMLNDPLFGDVLGGSEDAWH